MKKKWAWSLLGLGVLIVAFYWLAFVPAHELPQGGASLAYFRPGPYAVATESFEAVDRTRPTAPNHAYRGSAERVFKGALWRPKNLREPGPLLIYSHGFMSFHQEGEYLDRFLASRGYTVVAVDYPLTNYFAPGGPQLADVVHQPGDIRFLIDTLLRRSQDAADNLHGTIDAHRIAVAGVSLGGLTSTLAAYDRRLRDPRIAAAVSIAGPAYMFSPRFFEGSTVPFLMVAGDTDAIVPYAKNARPILDEFPGSVLVTLAGASHTGFAGPAATLLRFVRNPDQIGCKEVRKGLKNADTHFLDAISDADSGLVVSTIDPPCTAPLPATAMKAARQHMLTTLAVAAFLDSHFAPEAAARQRAQRFLLEILPAENAGQVKVETRPR